MPLQDIEGGQTDQQNEKQVGENGTEVEVTFPHGTCRPSDGTTTGAIHPTENGSKKQVSSSNSSSSFVVWYL